MPQENFLVEALIEVDAALLGCYRLQASSHRGRANFIVEPDVGDAAFC